MPYLFIAFIIQVMVSIFLFVVQKHCERFLQNVTIGLTQCIKFQLTPIFQITDLNLQESILSKENP